MIITIDIQGQERVLSHVPHGFEFIVNIGIRILDIDCGKVFLTRVVLKLLHEQHAETRECELSLELCLLNTLADL